MSVTCAEAAAQLGVSPSQVRRWVQAGAPVVREGRPMLVEVADLQRWRQFQAADALDALAIAMLHSVRCEMADGRTAPQLLSIDERRAAALMLAAYRRAHSEMTGRDGDTEVCDAIAQLRRIAGMPV
ncbi:helix-turn-helix domain-containing protein [Pseudorhodoferax sp. Leaf274]|uniref:helix-turn-helix domain-containing protein n=1 Tax=Pseudorhodoferax sp. Leaf274 TaxID=1736318 RepID=UPI000723BF8C|nr:helix-turn-helix domain-containing protein [Pseudorhodoferax sp. Leaf274]KQP35863.1 hypothetical protein ASF44_21440 [Pseudorhodoferax sp. Leaf274]